MIEKLKKQPEKLFLLDASGALTAFCLLFFVVANLEAEFGMPKVVCRELSYFAIFFFLYSFVLALKKPETPRQFLRILIAMNIGYGILSAVVVVFHSSMLSLLGWIYFSFDLLFITLIVFLEVKVYKLLKD